MKQELSLWLLVKWVHSSGTRSTMFSISFVADDVVIAVLHCQLPQQSSYILNMLQRRWIRRTFEDDRHRMLWLSRSPDFIPCDFFNVELHQGHIHERKGACCRSGKDNRLAHVDASLVRIDYRVDVCVSPVIHTLNIRKC